MRVRYGDGVAGGDGDGGDAKHGERNARHARGHWVGGARARIRASHDEWGDDDERAEGDVDES